MATEGKNIRIREEREMCLLKEINRRKEYFVLIEKEVKSDYLLTLKSFKK